MARSKLFVTNNLCSYLVKVRGDVSTSRTFVFFVILFISLMVAGCEKNASVLSFGGQEVSVPVPSGFNPVSAVAPDFMAFMRQTSPPNFVIVEYYLRDKDLHDVLAGHSKSRGQTLYFSTTRQMLSSDYNEDAFLADASEIRINAAKDAARSKSDQKDGGEIQSIKSDSPQILADRSKSLGIFFDQRDGIGTSMFQQMSTAAGTISRVNADITLRVRNRYVNLTCSSVINNSYDAENIKKICSDWAVGILKLN